MTAVILPVVRLSLNFFHQTTNCERRYDNNRVQTASAGMPGKGGLYYPQTQMTPLAMVQATVLNRKLHTTIKMTETTCIRCKFFRMKSSTKGICRVESKKENPDQPSVNTTFSCEQWQDCGQQYFIRLGWIKGQKGKKE